jgi:DNA-binding NtrC family response regulator
MSDNEQRLLMLIDEEPAQSRLVASSAAREGWRTLLIREPGSAITMLTRREDNDPGAVCLDLSIAGDDGPVIIAELRSRRPTMPIIVIVDRSRSGRCIEALRAGATDYLIKPVAPDSLIQALRSAAQRPSWGDELAPLSEKHGVPDDFAAMIGATAAFRTTLATASKAARGTGTLLVEGEPGTGKEALLRAIHAASARAIGPLRFVNAGCNAANAIESVLFGHEKDSFPGAFDQRAGVLQQCDGGTVVIDQIECLSPHVQARLLDFLQRGGVRPIGAQYSYRVDVRLLAASDTPLRERVEARQFNADLLAAISGTRVTLPPLRERMSDIPDLARHFVNEISDYLRPGGVGIDDTVLSLLSEYDWPGNVRQLRSTLFRAGIFCENDVLSPEDFPALSNKLLDSAASAPPSAAGQGQGIPLYLPDGNLRPLEEIEGDIIRLAISHYRGRMTEVARRLGIGRSTLYRKLNELGIDNAA